MAFMDELASDGSCSEYEDYSEDELDEVSEGSELLQLPAPLDNSYSSSSLDCCNTIDAAPVVAATCEAHPI